MAKARTTSTTTPALTRLQAENERLRAENERLKQQASAPNVPARASPARVFRKLGAIICTTLAVLLLVAGNLLFWTGNTIVKNDRFTEAVSPVIKQPAVQQALAKYTTAQLYSNVDVTQYIQQALPPRADFLAPSIAGQLQGFTQKALTKVLANPKFQTDWNQILSRAHARFIATVEQSGGDGTININELYQQLSKSLQGTKLSFLAGKQLPSKVGDIQVVSGSGIQTLHQVVVHIDAWRVLALLLFLLTGGLAIYLSRRRRRAVIRIALLSVVGLFVSLVALRIMRETIAGDVQPAYADAVRQTAQIVFHPLVVQTTLLLVVFALVAVVAWLTGASRSASYVQARIQFLLAGKLHHALFGTHENGLTRWVGRYKRQLQWTVVAAAAVLMLITQLTPMVLIVYAVVVIVLVLVIELLGAPEDVQDS